MKYVCVRILWDIYGMANVWTEGADTYTEQSHALSYRGGILG